MSSAVLNEVLTAERPGLSLDDFESAIDSLTAAERRRDDLIYKVRRLLDFVLALPGDLRRRWQEGLRSPSTELHQQRPTWFQAVDGSLWFLNYAESLMPAATTLAGSPLPGADKLAGARAELEHFAEKLRSRWTSLEELEELMASTFELPEWVLTGPIPPHLRPPQSWWEDEDDDPFAPLPDAPS